MEKLIFTGRYAGYNEQIGGSVFRPTTLDHFEMDSGLFNNSKAKARREIERACNRSFIQPSDLDRALRAIFPDINTSWIKITIERK